jgi:hypothetical protein
MSGFGDPETNSAGVEAASTPAQMDEQMGRVAHRVMGSLLRRGPVWSLLPIIENDLQ